MRISKTWLVTDSHINHDFLVKEGHRPTGWQELFFSNWRRLVQPIDIVIHLGDVIMGANGTLGSIMANLPGTKFLVRGNHDHGSNGWYMRHGFSFVSHGILHSNVWLTHKPQAVLPDGAVLNVHGHLHDSKHHGTKFPAHCKLLSLERVGYMPVEFEKFIGFQLSRKSTVGGITNGQLESANDGCGQTGRILE